MAAMLTDIEFQDLQRELAEAVREAQGRADAILVNGRTALNRLSSIGLVDRQQADGWMKDLAELFDELFYNLSLISALKPGMPWRLHFEYAPAWTTDIGAKISALTGLATGNTMQANNRWNGPAADAYRAAVAAQNQALAAMKPITNEIANSMTMSAAAVVAFWGAVLGFVVWFLLEEYAAAQAIAAVVTAPVGATIAGVAVGEIIAKLAALTGALTTAMIMLTIEYNDMLRTVSDNNPFPKGSWPTPGGRLWDASITDGTPSDWWLKRQ